MATVATIARSIPRREGSIGLASMNWVLVDLCHCESVSYGAAIVCWHFAALDDCLEEWGRGTGNQISEQCMYSIKSATGFSAELGVIPSF
jgi:hypothetical protein